MGKPDKRLDLGLDERESQEIIAKFFEPGEEPEVAYEHRTKISTKS